MTLDDLKQLLNNAEINYEAWPIIECGTIEELQSEIENHECTIAIVDGKPVRLIRVSSVLVYAFNHYQGMEKRSWQVLREDRHELTTGKVIDRGHLPNSVSEKLRNGENFEEAAHRALSSELGWHDRSQYFLHHNTATRLQDCIAAHRYIGLRTVVTEKTVWKCLIRKSLYDSRGYQIMVDGKTLHFHWEMLLTPPLLLHSGDE